MSTVLFSRVLLDVLGFTTVEATVVDVCCIFLGGEAIGSVWKSSTDVSIFLRVGVDNEIWL